MKKELQSNSQYHVAPRSLEEVDALVKALKDKGYTIYQGLDNVLESKNMPVGLCIDNGINLRNGGKCVFRCSAACLGFYCNWSHKKPLRVEDILDNMDKLIDNPDIEFYNKLLDKHAKEYH